MMNNSQLITAIDSIKSKKDKKINLFKLNVSERINFDFEKIENIQVANNIVQTYIMLFLM